MKFGRVNMESVMFRWNTGLFAWILFGLLKKSLKYAAMLGNEVISKKILRTRKIYHGDAQQREGRVLSTYPRRPKAKALWQHGWCSHTSSRSDRSKYRTYGTFEFSTRSARWRPANSDPAELHGRVPSARRRDDGDDVATNAGLRLSTATI